MICHLNAELLIYSAHHFAPSRSDAHMLKIRQTLGGLVWRRRRWTRLLHPVEKMRFVVGFEKEAVGCRGADNIFWYIVEVEMARYVRR